MRARVITTPEGRFIHIDDFRAAAQQCGLRRRVCGHVSDRLRARRWTNGRNPPPPLAARFTSFPVTRKRKKLKKKLNHDHSIPKLLNRNDGRIIARLLARNLFPAQATASVFLRDRHRKPCIDGPARQRSRVELRFESADARGFRRRMQLLLRAEREKNLRQRRLKL